MGKLKCDKTAQTGAILEMQVLALYQLGKLQIQELMPISG